MCALSPTRTHTVFAFLPSLWGKHFRLNHFSVQCSRTHRSQELPDILHVFNGEFSCKSFSKLNGNYETFKKAMQDEDEDA